MSNIWWLYTVVLGAAFALVAQSVGEDLKARRLIPGRRLFVTALIWQLFLLLLIVQVWVASAFYQRTVTEISVVSMFAFLCIPIGIFIMVVVLHGNSSTQTQSEEVVFDRSRPLFFGALIAIPAINIVHETILGNAGWDSDLAFQLLIVVGGVVGLVIRSRKLDNALGVAMIALILTYTLVGYSTLTLT